MSQEFPRVTEGYQGLPRVTKGYQELPLVTTGYHGLPQVTTGHIFESIFALDLKYHFFVQILFGFMGSYTESIFQKYPIVLQIFP